MTKTNHYKVTTDLSNLEATGFSKLGRWFEDWMCFTYWAEQSQDKVWHLNKKAKY